MLLSFSSLLLSAAALTPQLPEDPGPFLAGWQTVNFVDANYGAGTVRARVHYPALAEGRDTAPDLSQAPYQSIALMHGYLGSADGLDNMANHMASHGYLVVNLDTERGLFPNVPAYAVDGRAGLQWMEDESTNQASFLFGMAMVGDWAAIGHSMGGGTMGHLVGIEPRVRAIIGMQAADSEDPAAANMRAYTGAGLWIAGTRDRIVPPGTVKRWYDRAELASRRFYVNVTGMGHGGPTDTPPTNEPMPASEQQAVHRRMLIAFLDAEMRDEQAAYEFLAAGVGAGAPWSMQQQSLDPILWGGEMVSASNGLFGVHGLSGSETVFAWSTQLGSSATPFGNAGIDLSLGGSLAPASLGTAGFGKGTFNFPPTWTGSTVYFQAAVYQGNVGTLTDVLAVDVP